MILVLGSFGQLGTAFRTILGPDARSIDMEDLDLSDTETIYDRLSAYRPEMIINCAAYTAVDRAESEPEIARAINADAVREMAKAAGDLGARLVTFSTDYVFDGTANGSYVESDEPNPINIYGLTKREGEVAALAVNPDVLVVRTSWLLSGTHPNFASTMLRLAGGEGGRIVNDQRGHPTLVDDLAPAALEAVERGVTGILHLTNQGTASWFGLAGEIAVIAGLDSTVFEPCTTADFPTPARRPANSVLKSERLDAFGLHEMPHYREGLEEAVHGLVDRGLA